MFRVVRQLVTNPLNRGWRGTSPALAQFGCSYREHHLDSGSCRAITFGEISMSLAMAFTRKTLCGAAALVSLQCIAAPVLEFDAGGHVVGINGIVARLTGQAYDVNFLPMSTTTYANAYGATQPPTFLNDEPDAFWMSVDIAALLGSHSATLDVQQHYSGHQAVFIPVIDNQPKDVFGKFVARGGDGSWNPSEITIPNPDNVASLSAWVWPGSDFTPPLIFSDVAVWAQFTATDVTVPEPATVPLVIAALLALGATRRRKPAATTA